MGHRSHARVGDTSRMLVHMLGVFFFVWWCPKVKRTDTSSGVTSSIILPIRFAMQTSNVSRCVVSRRTTHICMCNGPRTIFCPADGVVTVRVAGAIFTCFTWRRRGRRGRRRRRRRRGVRSHEDNHRIHAVVCPREDTEDEDGVCGG